MLIGNKYLALGLMMWMTGTLSSFAQESVSDSIASAASATRRLSVGGYGEVAYSRNFYSDNQYRYKNWEKYKNDPSHGRFDIPHAVIYLGYDFGHGWTWGTEIEFEHTGTGTATEIEADEGGEYEQEVEKGGEVELEQLWINKRFSRALNIRFGHIIVPVGLNNAHHEPLNFFTVYRPEGENTILPSTWHDTGVSLWGQAGDFKYQLLMVAGMNAMQYSRDNFIKNGHLSAFEFKTANTLGYAFRLDNSSIAGLRIGMSGYYGEGMHNNYPNEMKGEGKIYNNVKATTLVGSVDMTYKAHNWIVRGQADYGYVSDTPMLNTAKANTQKSSNADVTKVGENAYAIGIEAGYDIFSQIACMRAQQKKLYVFGRYDNYNSYLPAEGQTKYGYTKRQCFTAGINYYPVKEIGIKADYSLRKFDSPYNNEPSLNVGVVYEGFFK